MTDPFQAGPDWVVAPSEGWVAPRGRTPDGRVLATQGRRVLAFLIDYVIWFVPAAIVTIPLVVTFLSFYSSLSSMEDDQVAELNLGLVLFLYVLLFALAILRVAVEAEKVARRGQTWGMQALHLRAVDARNGGSISRGRAWGRAAFASWISSQLFGFGYWWAFFDARNRALHDLVCGVVVIDER